MANDVVFMDGLFGDMSDENEDNRPTVPHNLAAPMDTSGGNEEEDEETKLDASQFIIFNPVASRGAQRSDNNDDEEDPFVIQAPTGFDAEKEDDDDDAESKSDSEWTVEAPKSRKRKRNEPSSSSWVMNHNNIHLSNAQLGVDSSETKAKLKRARATVAAADASANGDEKAEAELEPEEFEPPASSRLLLDGQEPAFCFLCAYGDPDEEDLELTSSDREMQARERTHLDYVGQDEVMVAFQAVLRMEKRNRKALPLPERVLMLHRYYTEHVQRTLTDHVSQYTGRSMPCPDWEQEVIRQHLLGIGGHRVSNRGRRDFKLALLDDIISNLYNHKIFFKDRMDPTGRKQDMSPEGIKLLLATSKHQEQIMAAQDRSRKQGSK